MEINPYCSELPVFNLESYLRDRSQGRLTTAVIQLCRAVADCLAASGALVIKDPRVDSADNDRFISLMESYFSQPTEIKMADVRSELAHQVGATPECVEKPRCLKDTKLLETVQALPEIDRPQIPTSADIKWRYFWRIGDRPKETRFWELNADPVIPQGFPQWEQVMNQWGGKMMDAVATVSEMLAIGFDLESDAFTQRMHLGPHLLAPTGADLEKYSNLNTVIAGYHYDLNFLTIHGKSRYPGLFIWLRGGKKIPIRIPEGCLLLQAGKQLEWLTGGHVKAGFHEVICTKDTVEAAKLARKENRPVWRVSSTVFSQIASDEILRPLGSFATEESVKDYPATPTGKYVQEELQFINLAQMKKG